jgi:Cd2+/Zn2+-exporting ATPase
MTQTLRIDLSILLPDAPDALDACVQRLVSLAAAVTGVKEAHINDGSEEASNDGFVVANEASRGPKWCIHYDPAQVTLAHVARCWLVTASVGGWSGIGATVIIHEGSTLVVLANALRLLTFRGPDERPSSSATIVDPDEKPGKGDPAVG